MGRRGLRRITVRGAVYRWQADWTYRADVRTLLLRIWGGDKTSQALHADLTTDWSGYAEHIAAARGRGESPPALVVDTSYVMPRDVRAIIEYGLAHGWDPTARGKPFLLTQADTPTLQGLKLTGVGMHNPNQRGTESNDQG
jgi:hypothetical protein